MYYNSTRNSGIKVSSAEAIVQGISGDGGLFLPCEIPVLTMDEIVGLGDMSYAERAAIILQKYLTDFTEDEIKHCAKSAYNTKNFATENITEIAMLFNKSVNKEILSSQFSALSSMFLLELWHGPTCAFKDMALQILPYLLTASAKKLKVSKEIIILTATSGDTGKAALDGFADVDGTRIMVFYPEDGVSAIQKLQMTTQDGANVSVCAVKGNFDDCQNGVKAIFTDTEIAKRLEENGMMFSSANSINWGRLVPQIVYYISAYAEMIKEGNIKAGEKINIAVPTGNFGNILAAWFAGEMGVPVNKYICASNKNKILTDFLTTGIYDKSRDFYTTISPSMDILISSNLERLLYLLCERDDALIKDWFGRLSKHGAYEVTDSVKAILRERFYAGFCDDFQTKDTIKNIYQKYSYTLDPHTAVAVRVYEEYREQTGDKTKTVIASTASPYKFSESVIDAINLPPPPMAAPPSARGAAYSVDSAECVIAPLPEGGGGEAVGGSEFAMTDRLFELSKLPVPVSLAELRDKEVRFCGVVDKDGLMDYVCKELNL